MKIAVVGATSRSGRYLVERLCAEGHDVVAIGRDSRRLAALDARASAVRADVSPPGPMRVALEGAVCVVSLAHARITGDLLALLPASCTRVVLTGSARRHGTLADPLGDEARAAEAAFLESGRAGVMLHPSMIYGAPDDNNVSRVLGYLRRWPKALPVPVPLPGGGRDTVQPVFIDDMVEAWVGAITRPEAVGPIIDVAGPEPIPYADFVRVCAAALGRRAAILTLPTGLLAGIARAAAALGLAPSSSASALRRAAESKHFEIGDMRRELGVEPRSLEAGVRLKIERGWG